MTQDHVDVILDQWRVARPDVALDGMAIIGRISRLERMVRPLLEAVFAEHGLESWEFDVLATLRRAGRLSPGQLLTSMMISSGAMTNRIDRLVERGFVSRVRSTDDGRQVLVDLTVKGRKVVDAALVDHAANEARLVSSLTPAARARLEAALRNLTHAVAAASEPPAKTSKRTR